MLFCLHARTNNKVSFAEGIHAVTLPLYTHILHNSSILLHGMVVLSTYFDHHSFKAERSCTHYVTNFSKMQLFTT